MYVCSDAAWFRLGPAPSEQGNAVIDGHVDTKSGAPAVFADLKTIPIGGHIFITDARNMLHVFIVIKTASVPANPFPTKQVFGYSDGHDLNLITCDGAWDSSIHTYARRFVVYSSLE